MQHIPLLSSRIIRPFVSYLDANGADTSGYLDRFRIPGEVIEAEGWISKKQVFDMLHDVTQRERCPGILLSGFTSFEINDLGPIANAIMSSRTVMDALSTFTSLAGLAYRGGDFYIKHDTQTAWLCWRERILVSSPSIIAEQAALAIYLKFLRLLLDQNWRPQQLLSQFRMDTNLQTVEGWEECRQIHNGDYTAIALPTSYLSREPAWAKEPIATHALETQWRPEREYEDDFVNSLHILIRSLFQFRELPTLEQVALMVGVSTRTITRRLTLSGLTYRRLLDRICFDRAREMLLVDRCTVKETALALGYPDTSKFVRSFRRMTGVTPGEYVRRVQ